MTEPKILEQGAEAVITLENNIVIKERIKKSYRIQGLDNKIRKLRTRSEGRLLEKASKLIPVPKVIEINEKEKEILMAFVKGEKLSNSLDNFELKTQEKICGIIGGQIARLHENNIIHGDLTTSNMILTEEGIDSSASQKNELNYNKDSNLKDKSSKNSLSLLVNQKTSSEQSERGKLVADGQSDGERTNAKTNMKNFKIYFIDFGLGFISYKLEDKAVDLHLLKQALEAKHFLHWKTLFTSVIKGYKISKEAEKILARLKTVEKRGRYKY